MSRKSLFVMAMLLGAIPALAHNTQIPASQFAAGQAPPAALRLMSDTEFATFLQRLDSDLLRAQMQMKKMDVKSLSSDAEEKRDLAKSQTRCLESLDSTRDEIQKLSQGQTLKLDLFLLIDLNQLARNLDLLDESLTNPMAPTGVSGAQKSLAYAREILSIDGSVASEMSTFQQHFIAFAGVVDATLQPGDVDAVGQPQSEK
jgi:hypothetical protein